MAIRKIIKIDESKCNGCGVCVPSCVEGALQIIDGKARLVKDEYCDGLGACLGDCPQGALEVIEREAPDFDEVAALSQAGHGKGAPKEDIHSDHAAHHSHGGGCPGSRMMVLKTAENNNPASSQTGPLKSELGQWPVQLHLVPINAPYFQGADLVIAADCAPLAYADFHRKFLRGKAVVIGCPKLDDTSGYANKLAQIFKTNDLNSITVVHMEVPCCFGLVNLVKEAFKQSGINVPVYDVTIGIQGEIKQ